MKQEILDLLESHRKWLSENTSFTILDDSIEINLPFLNCHNDYIQVYLVKKGDSYTLSDDGETIDDMRSCGLEFNSPKRLRLLSSAIIGFSVVNDNGILKVDATKEDFGVKLNSLIQAILAVNELLVLAQPVFPSDFRSNVEDWLRKNHIEFHGSKNIVGKSGVNHYFDFTIASQSNNLSQMVKLVNKPSMDIAKKIVFTSIDMPSMYSVDSTVVALLNDPENSNLSRFRHVLKHYSIETVHWSKRNESFTNLRTLQSTFRENDQLQMNI